MTAQQKESITFFIYYWFIYKCVLIQCRKIDINLNTAKQKYMFYNIYEAAEGQNDENPRLSFCNFAVRSDTMCVGTPLRR